MILISYLNDMSKYNNNNEIKKVYCYFEINLKNEKCCICFDKQKKISMKKKL